MRAWLAEWVRYMKLSERIKFGSLGAFTGVLLIFFVIPYFTLSDFERAQRFGWSKVDSDELVEIRQVSVNKTSQITEGVTTFIEVGQPYWANSSGEFAIEGIAGNFCFIEGSVWIPATLESAELIRRYKSENILSENMLLRSSWHMQNAPDWYMEQNQQ